MRFEPKEMDRYGLRFGDIVMCEGGEPGRCAIWRDQLPGMKIQKALHRIRPKELLDYRFLFYTLLHIGHSRGFDQYFTGATIKHLPGEKLAKVEVDFPPLPIQRRIAGILSAYDELIENSQRRIRILEAMARALYREWFVHFRFPGHENHPRVSSPLGEIPEGWEVKGLGQVADVNRAQINARTAPRELHYIDISSVSPGRIDSITTYALADAPGRARRIIQHGDVLWSCVRPNRRSHAQVMNPDPDTIASTGFAVLTPTKVPFTFLYCATTTDEFVDFLTNNATGSAYPAVTAATFERSALLVPTSPLLEKFGDVTISTAEEIHTLQRQIQNLRRTRDLLLPRLLSGHIEVEAA
ncbi:MAG: restriction endonuclease subunit S [Ardenticatenia bacterium]|nr:restriction endonuclease subunit S [Ardenticatenia bacterium]